MRVSHGIHNLIINWYSQRYVECFIYKVLVGDMKVNKSINLF